ncbi:DUF3006 domain-containing protein [Peptococcaceae bacterium 1198_IL3148]
MYIIDRFENEWAVIEFDRQVFNLPKSLLPPTAKAGDVITINISLNTKATEGIKQQNQALIDDIFKE